MSNEYFQPGSVPAPNAPGSSATVRGEFNSVSAGFDKLPALAGNADKLIAVDEFGTRLIAASFNLGELVTLTGDQQLTNKTLAWGDNTFPGFGDAATKNAGTGAGEVLLLAVFDTLPVLSAENLTNIPGLSLKADANNAVLTGAPVAPTPSTGDNSPRIATTQFVQEAVVATGSFAPSNATPLMDGTGSAGASALGSRDDHRHPSDTSRAPASAATASGTSFTPTGGVAATDVQAAIAELDTEKVTLASLTATNTTFTPAGGVAATNVQAAIAELDTEKATLASPVFTGDPRAPTPASSDNDTSIATTAYVKTVLAQQPVGMQPSNSSPLMNGTVAPGTGVEGSRYDHVHPVDTSRAAASAATATGTSFTPTGGVAATNVQTAIAELDTEKAPLSSGVPAGAVMDFAMNSAPSGWLACDGAAVNRTTYAALFAAIGTTWGAGNGTTTFNLPDTRGRYRATAGTDGTADSKTFAQKLGDAIRNITGSAGAVYRAAGLAGIGAMNMTTYGTTPAVDGVAGSNPGDNAYVNFDASLVVPTAAENRPYTVVFQTCIKT